jgi:hypothetical protein
MSRRWVVTAGIIVWSSCTWAAVAASAQDVSSPLARTMPKLSFASIVLAPTSAAHDVDVPAMPAPTVTPRVSFSEGSSHFRIMTPMYAATATLQLLDMHSTLQVVRQGGGEANPLLQGVVAHPAAFAAVKAGIAAGMIYSASRMARHNKLAAVLTMAAMNSVYAVVVAHNYQLARSMR